MAAYTDPSTTTGSGNGSVGQGPIPTAFPMKQIPHVEAINAFTAAARWLGSLLRCKAALIANKMSCGQPAIWCWSWLESGRISRQPNKQPPASDRFHWVPSCEIWAESTPAKRCRISKPAARPHIISHQIAPSTTPFCCRSPASLLAPDRSRVAWVDAPAVGEFSTAGHRETVRAPYGVHYGNKLVRIHDGFILFNIYVRILTVLPIKRIDPSPNFLMPRKDQPG